MGQISLEVAKLPTHLVWEKKKPKVSFQPTLDQFSKIKHDEQVDSAIFFSIYRALSHDLSQEW